MKLLISIIVERILKLKVGGLKHEPCKNLAEGTE